MLSQCLAVAAEELACAHAHIGRANYLVGARCHRLDGAAHQPECFLTSEPFARDADLGTVGRCARLGARRWRAGLATGISRGPALTGGTILTRRTTTVGDRVADIGAGNRHLGGVHVRIDVDARLGLMTRGTVAPVATTTAAAPTA